MHSGSQRLMQKMDVVVAWGGSEAIRWAVEHTPPHAELIKFGPKKASPSSMILRI